MRNRRLVVFASLTSAVLTAQVDRAHQLDLQNWSAPLYWQPTAAETTARGLGASVTAAANLPLGSNALVFVAMTPCRVVDTRSAAGFTGAFGPPSLAGGVSRTFPILYNSACSIPNTAQGFSLNVTVVPAGPLSFLTIYPTGQGRPTVSTLNSTQGQVVANAAAVPAGAGGSIDVFASNNTDLVIDINGYYSSPTDNNFNTAIGAAALMSNTIGNNNTAAGYGALQSNANGYYNTAVGVIALADNTSGLYNTAEGEGALFSNTTGSYNIAIGASAGQNLTTGNNNIIIGSYNGSAGMTNTIVIGDAVNQSRAFIYGIRAVTTGNGSGVPVLIDSNGQLGTATSSARFKEDIRDMSDARRLAPFAAGHVPLPAAVCGWGPADRLRSHRRRSGGSLPRSRGERRGRTHRNRAISEADTHALERGSKAA